jgi:hypothetical protein
MSNRYELASAEDGGLPRKSGRRERQDAGVSERWTTEHWERRERVHAEDWRALGASERCTS